MEYILACAADIGQLEAEVSALINDGWTLVGGVAVRYDGMLFQALAKRDSE